MPLRVPPAPAPALRSVLTALGSSRAAGKSLKHTVLDSLSDPWKLEFPLPVHVLDDIAAQDAPQTRLTGWRFLIWGQDRAVAAAEAMLTADGWAFGHFREGPYVASTALALEQAEALPTVYQPRLLSVPALYMLTLWLHGDPAADATEGQLAADDLLVPLAPAPPGIAAHRARRAADLLPMLSLRAAPPPLLGSPA